MDIRIIKCFDGLNYSFELLDYYYSDLYKSCTEINSMRSNHIKALASCWGFIDALHRIREIAQSVPGLNKKEGEMRIFLAATKLAETYRHYIQHLRGELSKKDINPFPVWGSLSWVDESDLNSTQLIRSHVAIAGTQINGVRYMGCAFNTTNLKWVSRVCLSINDQIFNFDPIYESCLRFKKFVIPQIESIAGREIKPNNEIPIMTSTIDLASIIKENPGVVKKFVSLAFTYEENINNKT